MESSDAGTVPPAAAVCLMYWLMVSDGFTTNMSVPGNNVDMGTAITAISAAGLPFSKRTSPESIPVEFGGMAAGVKDCGGRPPGDAATNLEKLIPSTVVPAVIRTCRAEERTSVLGK